MTDDDGLTPAQRQDAGYAKKVTRASGAALAGTLVSLPVAVVSTLLLARALGPSDFGRYALLGLVLILIPGLTDLGISVACNRGATVAWGNRDQDTFESFLAKTQAWALLRFPITVIVAVLVLPGVAALIFVAGVFIRALLTSIGTGLGATLTLRPLIVSSVLSNIVSAVAAVITALRTKDPDLTFAVFVLGQGLPAFITIRPGRALLTRSPFRLAKPTLERRDLTFGFASWLNGTLATLVASRTELLFFREGQAVDRGQFALALTVAGRAVLLLDSLYSPLSTTLALKHGEGEAALRSAVQKSLRLSAQLTLTVAPGLVLGSIYVGLPLAGDAFQAPTAILLGLTLVAVLASSLQPLYGYFYAARITKPTTIATLAALATNLVLSAALIPPLGLLGAALASGGGGVAVTLVLIAFILRDQRFRSMFLRHLGAVSVTFFLTSALVLVVETSTSSLVWQALVAVGLSILSALLTLRYARLLSEADVSTVVSGLPESRRQRAGSLSRFLHRRRSEKTA